MMDSGFRNISSKIKVTTDMANHFSALKRARQTEKRTATNRANASRLRTALRTLRETIEKGDKQAAEQTYRATVSALDKAIQKGTLHENTAARYKSRLGARVGAMK
jgi:small subunit ribosomal protein S20